MVKQFELRCLAEGENRGKLGIFDDGQLIGVGSFKPSISLHDRGRLALLAESGAQSEQLLAELIQRRMMEFNESYSVAEVNVVRTQQGRILWEQARVERLDR